VRRLALALALAGCASMAPRYERPASPVPAQLPGGTGAAAALPWRELVREPRLGKLIDQALAQNRELRAAVIAIESARAQYRIQRAQQLPSIDAVANVTSTRQPIGDGVAATTTVYSAQVGLAAWEIDLFGRLRSLATAKQHAYLATIEAARATRLSLVAELASAWLTLAADRSRLAIATETMATAKRTMDLTEQLVGGGTSNRGDYWQVATVYQQARADVALLTAAIAQDRNAIELLAGGPVADELLPGELASAEDWLAEVPVGVDSSVLLERPDVQAAEHELIAANANIGEARARFFPSLTLTASGGLASLSLAALFSGPTAVFAVAPTLAVPLFRGGANRANLALAGAEQRRLVAGYELAIQRAFREVADALAVRATIREQVAAQQDLVAAAKQGFELSTARYKAGVESFLATLVAQRALYDAQRALVATRLAAIGNRLALYRALAR
jgi:outer membrane protein, multidrug efflux system